MNIYEQDTPAEDCFIEENVQFWSTNAETLTTDAGIEYVDSITECKEFCETTFPEEAKFFTYNDEDAEVKKKWRGSCRCKKDKGDIRDKRGVFSGNLNCGTPAPEPPARWRSPGDWKCGSGNLAPNGRAGICNPTSHAPCCSTHGWCGKGDPWCGNGGTDFREVDDFPA